MDYTSLKMIGMVAAIIGFHFYLRWLVKDVMKENHFFAADVLQEFESRRNGPIAQAFRDYKEESNMPIIQPPPVSKQLQDAIRKAELMHDFISATIPDNFVGDTDSKLFLAAFYSLISEHHGAILYLLKAGRFDGSALALVRPLIDGAYRAHWIYSCAKPDIVTRVKNGEDAYPGLVNMATEIEKKVDAGGMFTSIAPYIKALHGYTHGGLEQLGRRFDATGTAVRPNYSDGEKLEAVKSTTAHLTALAIAWCQIISTTPPESEPLSKKISDHYSAEYSIQP